MIDTARIVGIVYAVIVAFVSFYFFGPLSSAADTVYREYIPHCEIDQVGSTAVIHQRDSMERVTGTPVRITNSSGECAVQAAVGTWYTESGHQIIIATANTWPATATSAWTTPDSILTRFGSINRLMANLMPLVVVLGFIGTAAITAVSSTSVRGGISSAVTGEVLILIVALVTASLLPTLLQAIVDSAGTLKGQFLVTSGFGTIITLIISILPLLINVSILGIFLVRGGRYLRSRYG